MGECRHRTDPGAQRCALSGTMPRGVRAPGDERRPSTARVRQDASRHRTEKHAIDTLRKHLEKRTEAASPLPDWPASRVHRFSGSGALGRGLWPFSKVGRELLFRV